MTIGIHEICFCFEYIAKVHMKNHVEIVVREQRQLIKHISNVVLILIKTDVLLRCFLGN